MLNRDVSEPVAACSQGSAFDGSGVRIDCQHLYALRPKGGRQRYRAAAASQIQNTITLLNLHRRHKLPGPWIDFTMGKNTRPAEDLYQAATIAKRQTRRGNFRTRFSGGPQRAR